MLDQSGAILGLLGTFLNLLGGGYKLLKEVRADNLATKVFNQNISDKLGKLDVIEEMVNVNRVGIKNIHRYRLQEDLRRAIKRGHTTSQELEETTHLYDSYVALQGNGPIKALFEKFAQLPIKEDIK